MLKTRLFLQNLNYEQDHIGDVSGLSKTKQPNEPGIAISRPTHRPSPKSWQRTSSRCCSTTMSTLSTVSTPFTTSNAPGCSEATAITTSGHLILRCTDQIISGSHQNNHSGLLSSPPGGFGIIMVWNNRQPFILPTYTTFMFGVLKSLSRGSHELKRIFLCFFYKR